MQRVFGLSSSDLFFRKKTSGVAAFKLPQPERNPVAHQTAGNTHQAGMLKLARRCR